jgi:hypothetical protein
VLPCRKFIENSSLHPILSARLWWIARGSSKKERSEYGPMPFALLVVLVVVAAVALLILIYVLVQRWL